MKLGASPIGHACQQRPQPIQAEATLLTHSFSSKNNKLDVVFPVQTLRENTASPIIGPPFTMRAQFSSAPQKSASSRSGVPFLTQKLPGLATAPPETVMTRS